MRKACRTFCSKYLSIVNWVGVGTPLGEIGWGGAAGANALIDIDNNVSFFYAHHMLNNQEGYVQPRLRNVLYECIK